MRTQPNWILSAHEVAAFRQLMMALGPRLAILIAQLDPDGLASAIGLATIARQFGVSSTIYYGGQPGHPQTLHLLRLFALSDQLHPLSEFDWASPVALVDSSALCDHRLGSRQFDPVIIIDHHQGGQSQIDQHRFWYLAPCGAAASLIIHLAHELDPDFEFDPLVATALAVGIETDTDGFKRPGTTGFDRQMSTLAMLSGSEALFQAASNFTLSERCCQVVESALGSRRFSGRVLIAQPNTLLDVQEGEYLAMAAELLSMHQDADCVLVYGVTDGEIRLSARTRHDDVDLHDLLIQLFGPEFSGAKPGAGGARFPIAPSNDSLSRRARAVAIHSFSEWLHQQLIGLKLRS